MMNAVPLSVSTAGRDSEQHRISNKAVFLDRDGTLIKDVHYLSDITKIKILPHVIDGLCRLQTEGFVLHVVTNQSGIERQVITHEFVNRTHEVLRNQLHAHGIVISNWLYCPHLKSTDCCCRKPRIGLLTDLTDIDWGASWMLGDKLTDVQFGLNAGMRAILINPDGARGVLYSTVPDMQKAVEVICANEANS